MKVTDQDVKIVASLSRLNIDGEETKEVIAQLDTSKIEPTTYAVPMQNVFRDDKVKPSLERDLALSNAPLKEDGYFKVPRVLEE